MLIGALLVFFGLVALVMTFQRNQAVDAGQRAQQAEQSTEAEKHQRTVSLFDSTLTHASLLAKMEDYAEASAVLRATYPLDAEIALSRRHARNLLASVAALSGGAADKVYQGAGAALAGGLALSPDGKWLAAAGERATLVLFDAHSGELVRRLEGHDATAGQVGAVFSIVFDPQSRSLYSGGEDKRIIRWSIPDGAKLEEWQAPAEVMALALSPDGKLLASGGQDKEITLWDIGSTGRCIEPVEMFRPRAEGEAPPSAGTEHFDRLNAPPRATVLRTLSGHTGVIAAPNGLAFSPPRQRLV